MTTQINVKLDDELHDLATNFQKARGYLSMPELIREALREKIFDSLEIRPEYVQKISGKEANTFLSDAEADLLDKELQANAKKEIQYAIRQESRQTQRPGSNKFAQQTR